MGKTFSTGLLTNGIWQDSSNNIGIGAAPSGSYKFEVTGTGSFSSNLTAGNMFVNTTDNSSGSKLQVFGSINFKGNSGYNGWIISQAGGNSSAAFNLSYGSGGASNVITAQYDTGNVGINTTTDSGYKLDVNGTGRFSGDADFRSNSTSLWWGGSAARYGQLNWNTGEAIIAATTGNQLTFRTNGVSSAENRLVIASTGAATFSSSVTATEGKFSLDGGTEPTYITGTAGKFIRSASGIYGGVKIALVGGSAGGDNGFDFYNTSTLVGQFGYGAGGLQFYFTKNVTSQAGFISHSDSYSPNGFYKLKPNPSITAARWWRITSDLVSYGDFSIGQSSQNDDASYTSRLYINPAGATTITTATAAVGLTVNGGNSSDGTVGKFSRGGAEKNFYISATNNQYVNLGTEGDFRFKTGVTVDQPYATGVNAMVITSTGNVLMGTITNPGANGTGLAIYASDYPRITLRNSTTGDTTSDGLQMYMVGNNVTYDLTESGYQRWNTSGVERMRIINNGNISMATDVDYGYKLNLNGQPGCNGYTAWTNWSDYRLKENITDFDATNVLDRICAIRPVTYNYNELSGFDEETRARRISGFIAQELKEVFPDMVGTIKKDGVEYYDTNLSNLDLYIVKAIQQLAAEIKTLKNK